MDKNANILVENKFEQIALMLAAEYGHEAVVRLLLDKGADIVARDNDGETLLLLAANFGHIAVV